MKLVVRERQTGAVIAQAEEGQGVRVFEGNWYFDPSAVDMTRLRETTRTYTCPYKGICNWVDIETDTGRASNIAWIYRQPKPGYEFIRDQVAFYARDTAATRSIREESVATA